VLPASQIQTQKNYPSTTYTGSYFRCFLHLSRNIFSKCLNDTAKCSVYQAVLEKTSVIKDLWE
jgi:hypothetical protein